MGFLDHLYPSTYYNEEELLTSDEYPPPLVNICAKYCANHLSKTLLEKHKKRSRKKNRKVTTLGTTSTSKMEFGDEGEDGGIDLGDDALIPMNIATEQGGVEPFQQDLEEEIILAVESSPRHHHQRRMEYYRLRAGVRLPSELSEKIFGYLDKHTSSSELMGGGAGGGSSSSSSSSSGDGGLRGSDDSSGSNSSSTSAGSSSSDDDDDDGGGGGAGAANDFGGARVAIRGGQRAAAMRMEVEQAEEAGGEGGAADDDDLLLDGGAAGDRRMMMVMRRRRRRQQRMRGMERRAEDVVGEAMRATYHLPRRRVKKRMLWNGGVVDENGSGRGSVVGGYQYNGEEGGGDGVGGEMVEIVGFDDVVGPLFQDTTALPLTKLNLRTSTAVTDKLLATLLTHHPKEVDLHECVRLTCGSLRSINANSQNLLSLSFGNSQQILLEQDLEAREKEPQILSCPKLMKLVVWGLLLRNDRNLSSIGGGEGGTLLPERSCLTFWRRLTCSFTQTLTSLDLSGCGEFDDFEWLREFKVLRSLVLYNVLISGRVRAEVEGDGDDDNQEGCGDNDQMMVEVTASHLEVEQPSLPDCGNNQQQQPSTSRGSARDGEDDPPFHPFFASPPRTSSSTTTPQQKSSRTDIIKRKINHVVIFLKDEDEGAGAGQQQQAQRRRRAVEGEGAGGEGAGEQAEPPAPRSAEYYEYRKRLEYLVNKLVSPICELKELRQLDISTSSDPSTSASLQLAAAGAQPYNNSNIGAIPTTPWSTYPNPNQVLSVIVQNLPKLTHLDISGTNLAGRGVATSSTLYASMREDGVDDEQDDDEDEAGGGEGVKQPRSPRPQQPQQASSSSSPSKRANSTSSSKLCDIPGLNSRVDNPLEFLGLYGTAHDASHRHCIPAKHVSGDKDEAQILVACEAYIHRHDVLEKVLNDLFHLFRSERGTQITKSLRLILRAMNLHPREKHVQISGSASLFYIVKNEQQQGGAGGENHCHEVINPPMKRMILSTIVNAMAIHKVDSTMARNGCLTICHFRIPQDVMFIYAKLVKILLKILGQSIGPHQRHESFVERIAIYLLNSLACQVEGWHKRLVGELGAMKRMLQLIRDRLSRLECDDVMEIAWSTMWNVTDETPENCQKFLKNDGMILFLKCLHTFPNKPELLRNMMGLLGNVAEVSSLRKQLMTSVFISVFCKLLDSTQDNIEVSYNAAGVLAHMLSDGGEAWGVTIPSRDVVRESMVRNVNRWNINSTRNINYRSFEPILRLLRVGHTRECQLWGAWALANLTRVYPEKYVPLVEKEQGLAPLRDLVNEPLVAVMESSSTSPSPTTSTAPAAPQPQPTPTPTPSTSSSSTLAEPHQPNPEEPSTSTSTQDQANIILLIQQDVKKYAKITLQNVEEYNKKGKIDLASYMDG